MEIAKLDPRVQTLHPSEQSTYFMQWMITQQMQEWHFKKQEISLLQKEMQAKRLEIDSTKKMLQACLLEIEAEERKIALSHLLGRPEVTSSSSSVPFVPSMAFGKAMWELYFGNVGVEPALPDDIEDILEGPCPIWPGKKMGETHLLTLIPASVDGRPFNLNLLEKLTKAPKGERYKAEYSSFMNVIEQYGDRSPSHSYWVLYIRDVLPETRGKHYKEQKRELAEQVRHYKRLRGEVPGILEATTSILTHYVRVGERLFKNKSYFPIFEGFGFSKRVDSVPTFTRCVEKVYGSLQTKVGCFSPPGGLFSRAELSIDRDSEFDEEYPSTGLAVSWKLDQSAGFLDDEWQESQQMQSVEVLPLVLQASTSNQLSLSKIAFGAADWSKYIGDVGVEPPLPKDIQEILEGPCPIWLGKKMGETHLLTLIPATVNGCPFNLGVLRRLVKSPKGGGHKADYCFKKTSGFSSIEEEYTSQSPPQAYWVLLSRDILPGTFGKGYALQKKELPKQFEGYKGSILKGEMPTILEAATSILMHFIRSGERLLKYPPSRYILCNSATQYMLSNPEAYESLFLGSFGASGPRLFSNATLNLHYGMLNIGGLGVAWKFEISQMQGELQECQPALLEEKMQSIGILPQVPQASTSSQPSLPKVAFGAVEWSKYFGDIGVEPALPANIDDILEGPCPIWTGKKMRETHLLTLIPATVDGQPLSLNLLQELIQSPKEGGYQTSYRYYWDKLKWQYGTQTPSHSYWVMLSRDVFRDTRDKSFKEQRSKFAIIGTYQQLRGEVPGILEATVSVLMHYVRSGERLFSDSPRTWTRCLEIIEGYQTVLGDFSEAGLDLNDGYFDYDDVGLAISWKL